MADDSIAEELVMALGAALIRSGALDVDDIVDAAARATKGGGKNSAAVAHALNCMAIEAAAPDPGEWQAEQRRSQMHVVPSK